MFATSREQFNRLTSQSPPGELTYSDVNITSGAGSPYKPCALTLGNILCRATSAAYRLEIVPPVEIEGEREVNAINLMYEI